MNTRTPKPEPAPNFTVWAFRWGPLGSAPTWQAVCEAYGKNAAELVAKALPWPTRVLRVGEQP